MRAEIISAVVGAVIIIATLVASVTYYHIKKDEALKSSVESAIVKGIDPMAVRCAYGSSDTVCLVYAASLKK